MNLIKALLTGAVTMLLLGCNHNMPDMQTGKQAYDAKDWNAAFYHYSELSDFGVPRAKTELGKMYLYGKGVPQDPDKALALFREAEMLGETQVAPRYIPRAKTKLGALALQNEPDTVSPEKGVQLLQEAAANGNAQAMFELGLANERGLGIVRNPRAAESYYKQASANGYARADFYLAELYRDGALGLPDPALAAQHYEKAGLGGYPRGFQELGRMYEEGEGLPVNLGKAEEYFTLAGDKGVEVVRDMERIQSKSEEYL